MSETAPVVSVVDDDPSVRRAIKRLISSVGLHVQVFPSGQELLKSKNLGEPGCLILDIRLPGISGLDFQKNLAESDIHLPVIFCLPYQLPTLISWNAMIPATSSPIASPYQKALMLPPITRVFSRPGKDAT